VEIFEQLRGDAHNQVDNAKVGIAHNIGGPTAVSAVTVMGVKPV
jgi:acetyl-CoA C-acetyltransferase